MGVWSQEYRHFIHCGDRGLSLSSIPGARTGVSASPRYDIPDLLGRTCDPTIAYFMPLAVK